MSALLDCEQVSDLQPVDKSMVITAVASGITVTVGNVKTPALTATWTAPASQYVVGIQFEYVDAQGRAVQTQSQRKDKAIWQTSDGIVAGATYQVRYRATGIEDKAFGEWSVYQAVLIPAVFVSGDSAAVAGIPSSTLTTRLTTVEALAVLNATGVSDLEEIYGDTVSAAASAIAAGNAANLAVLKAQEADGAASAANVSAGTASTKASEAGTSAAAASVAQVSASTSSVAAQRAAIATFPNVILADLFSQTTTGSAPENKASLPESWVVAGVFTPQTGQAGTLGFKQYLPWAPGTVFDITAVYNAPAGGDPTGYGRVFALRAGADYGVLGSYYRPGQAVAPGTEVTQTARYGMGVTPVGGVQIAPTAGLAWVSIGAQINLNDAVNGSQAGARGRIKSLIVRDVTALAAAEGSASASATSASNAAASETAAGQSATASSGSATQAATRAGEALTYRNQSSDARDGAVAAQVASGVSASSAQGAANRLIPDRVSSPSDFINANAGGAPEGGVSVTEGSNTTTTEQGLVRQFNGSVALANRGGLKIDAARTYRVTTLSRIITGAAGNVVRNGFILYDASWTPIYYVFNFPVRAGATGWLPDPSIRTGADFLGVASNAVYVRGALHSGLDGGGASLPGVVWQAASIRLEDVTESASAGASAAAALTQAANASASASSASISANLAAQAGIGSLNKNPTYSDWPTGQSLPNNIGSFGSVTIGKAAGKVSANAIQLEVASGVSNAGVEVAWTQTNWNGRLPVVFGQDNYWVIDYKIEVGTPGLQTSALRFLLTNGATGANASAIIVKRLSELHTSTGDDQIVEGSQFFNCNPTVNLSNYSARLAFFARTDPLSNYGRYFVHKLAVRPASATEIAYGVALPAVQSQLSVTAATTADIATRMATARFEVVAAAGGSPAQLLIRADSSGSLAALVAQEIAFSNVVGGTIVRVMRIVNGSVFITGKLYIGGAPGSGVGYILLDGINMRIEMFDETDTIKMRIGKLS